MLYVRRRLTPRFARAVHVPFGRVHVLRHNMDGQPLAELVHPDCNHHPARPEGNTPYVGAVQHLPRLTSETQVPTTFSFVTALQQRGAQFGGLGIRGNDLSGATGKSAPLTKQSTIASNLTSCSMVHARRLHLRRQGRLPERRQPRERAQAAQRPAYPARAACRRAKPGRIPVGVKPVTPRSSNNSKTDGAIDPVCYLYSVCVDGVCVRRCIYAIGGETVHGCD